MTIGSETDRIDQATIQASRRALVAGCVGNLVEWYDFALYGAFATIISVTFFPGGDSGARLLATFTVFAVAFVARPVGALLFANWGDRRGRQRALAAGILLMGAVTAGIGLLPGYKAIGWAAPVLLVALRAGQGLAVGGEYGGSAAFVVEYAPPDRRGGYGGWHWATIGLGLAAGIAVAALASAVLPLPALRAWGWRLPFLLGLPMALVGLYIRTRLEETPGFLAVQRVHDAARTPLRDTLRTTRRPIVIGFGIVAAATVNFNIFYVFLPSHLATSGRAPLPRALAGALAGLLVAVLLGYAVIGLVLGVAAPSSFLAELFPTRLRYSGLSLTFGLASALFGGTAPALATVLTGSAGNATPAAWYATAVTAVAVVCLLAAPETAHRALDDSR